MGSFAIAAMAMKVAFAVLALVVCAYAIPEEDIHSALSDLTSLVQEQKSAPEVAEYSVEQFATLMNRIVGQAGKMRVVMNKLGISDTDSVEKVEQHFINLGESGHHGDLGEGNTSEEQLRLHGLQARSCVKHAVTCSHMAASCHATPKHCKAVVENCSRAAAACGVEDVGESEKAKEEKIVEQPKGVKEGLKSKPEKSFLPNPTPSGYFHKKKAAPHKAKKPVKKKAVKKKAKAAKKAKKHAPAIELIEEEAGEDEHDDLARFKVDDDSEALEDELSEAEIEAETEAEE